MAEPGSNRSPRNLLSLLLFGLAIALLAYAGYTYIQGRQDQTGQAPPPHVAGHAELKNVSDALVAQGLTVEYGRDAAPAGIFSEPGQQLLVEGTPLYVFIFDSPEARAAETENIVPDQLLVANQLGTPVVGNDTPVAMAEGSNVATLLVGGDADLAGKVQVAIEGLP